MSSANLSTQPTLEPLFGQMVEDCRMRCPNYHCRTNQLRPDHVATILSLGNRRIGLCEVCVGKLGLRSFTRKAA